MRPSSSELLQQAKQLWLTCFPQDDPDFVERYFAFKYTRRCHYFRLVDGRIASQALYLPFTLRLDGRVVRAGYVSGLCTHPHFRRSGLAREVLAHIHGAAANSGVALSLLIPSGEDLRFFYTLPHNGAYATISRRRRVEIVPPEEIPKKWNVQEVSEFGVAHRMLCHSAQQQLGAVLVSSTADWMFAMDEARRSGGLAVEVRRSHRPMAFALLVPCKDGWLIRSAAAFDEAALPLVAAWLRKTGREGKLFQYAACRSNEPGNGTYMMGKVLNPSKLNGVFGREFSSEPTEATKQLAAALRQRKFFSQNLFDE